jgi:serpin B
MTTVDAALADATAAVPTDDPSRTLTVDAANSLWAQRGVVLLESFVEAMGTDFGAGVRLTDFAGDPEAARAAINGWVAELTKGLIPELCPPGTVTAETLLTLVNAVYFAANWQAEFSRSAAALTFAAADGPRQVPAFGGVTSLATAAGDGWRSVTVPYVGGGAAMTIILPDTGRFAEVQAGMDVDLLVAAQHGIPEQVALKVPVFSVDTALSLTEPLTAMAPAIFTDGFTEIAADTPLFPTEVVHQAVVSVDENGTVAAAATAMAMAGSAAPATPTEFTVDRPFLFVISDTATGAPLFLGRVLDPAA